MFRPAADVPANNGHLSETPITMVGWPAPQTIKELRQYLELSQTEFGRLLWDAVHGIQRRGEPPFTRSYVSMLERGKSTITSDIRRGLEVIVARLDGADDVHARARQINVLAINDLPPGTVILGTAHRCANPGCPVVFVPTHPRQKYHCRMCASLARNRANGRH